MTDEDLNTLLFCSFRYVLGRRTYITRDVAELIVKNSLSLSKRTRELIQREIFAAIDVQGAGDWCDIESWEYVLENI